MVLFPEDHPGHISPHFLFEFRPEIEVMFLVLMDATVLPYQLTFKSTDDPDDFDAAWLWITTLVFGLDVVTRRNTSRRLRLCHGSFTQCLYI